ncbi:aspartate/glutamate racemase family protein [Candidatus Gracilibacteria bacterium]|nr:aspartate/glutamate racemase family protein [Candidatus Gracilibacteria bacterium]
MIGFFDSGFGGVQTLKYFKEMYSDFDYVFLADGKNCPYGPKSGDEIKKLTFDSLDWLFDNGAEIVILACNTAAAYSVRNWQTLYPEKKVLSITIPGIEEILSRGDINGNVGILATQATVTSGIFDDLFTRFGGDGNPDFSFVSAPELVDLVESGFENEEKNIEIVKNILSKFPSNIKYLVLGCTHFPVLMKYFKMFFDGVIVDPSYEAARKFGDYLKNHPEISSKLTHNGILKFYTTGNAESFETIGSKIFGQKIIANGI